MVEENPEVRTRKLKLQEVSKHLKEHFEGIDDVIDSIIRRVEIWWCYPEFLTRPTIINLWGLTGCGKTDLIRRFATEIGFADRFISIEMDNSKIDPYVSENGLHSDFSILGRLYNTSILPTTQAIVSLDDFHRYRSIYEDAEVERQQYDDVWKLLSDGRLIDDQSRIVFIKKTIDGLRQYMCNMANFSKDDDDGACNLGDGVNTDELMAMGMDKDAINSVINSLVISNAKSKLMRKRNRERLKRSRYMWNIGRFLNTIGVTDEDRTQLMMYAMMTLDEDERTSFMSALAFADERGRDTLYLTSLSNELLLTFLSKKYDELRSENSSDSEKFVYSKLLIFINGNLDEAFHPKKDEKNQVEDYTNRQLLVESIDELYEYTKKLTVDDIKSALLKLFRPEHVARLGSNHIIYHSLREENFDNIIRRGIQHHIDKLKQEYEIDVSIDDRLIIKAVKAVGIFPSQGVRPVFSATDSVLSQIIPEILIYARENNESTIRWPFPKPIIVGQK